MSGKYNLFWYRKLVTNGISFQAAGIWYPKEYAAPSYWQENAENRTGRPDAARRVEVAAPTFGKTRSAENWFHIAKEAQWSERSAEKPAKSVKKIFLIKKS